MSGGSRSDASHFPSLRSFSVFANNWLSKCVFRVFWASEANSLWNDGLDLLCFFVMEGFYSSKENSNTTSKATESHLRWRPACCDSTSVEWCRAVDVAGHERGLRLFSDCVIPHSTDAALRRQTTRQNMLEYSLWTRRGVKKYFFFKLRNSDNKTW